MLTRISMWDNEHGWQPTSPQEAINRFPYSVPSESHIFLCELCSQYATFVVGTYEPHFKHPVGSEDCVQKSTSLNYYHTNPHGFSLPLKIKFSGSDIDVLIGFLPVVESALQTASKNNSQLKISANGQTLRTFDINANRFSSEQVTYLSVGSTIAEQYSLSYPSQRQALNNNYWPTLVDGFSSKGTLFDYESGKRLPRNANVVIGEKYHLFTLDWTYCFAADIIIEEVQKVGNYRICTVTAQKLTRSADDFFRRFDCRLTANHAILTLLYPFGTRSAHIIIHNADRVWFHKTNGFIEVYPQNYSGQYKSDIFAVNSGFQQMLSLSRFEGNSSVLRYIMLRKVTNIPIIFATPTATIYDERGEKLIQSEYYVLPPKRQISVLTEFDGYIEVVADKFVINKIALKGGVKTIIDVDFNRQYSVYQGCDCIYNVSFVRKKNKQNIADNTLLYKLQSYKGDNIAITHSFGAVIGKLANYSKISVWLKKQVANGRINRCAKLELQKIVEVNNDGR